MEYYGFGGNNFGPYSHFWPDEVLKSLLNELSESSHTHGTQVVSRLPPDDGLLEFPNLSSFMGCAHRLMEYPLTKQIGLGVVATTFICAVWKIKNRWGSDGIEKEKVAQTNLHPPELTVAAISPRIPASGDDCFETSGDGLSSIDGWSDEKTALLEKDVSETTLSKSTLKGFQKQLLDVLNKLEQARVQLNELENDKDFLVSEIEVRQTALQSLQVENQEERDKRQKAEMKIEVVEFENVQLKKMRKELTEKAGQLERLANCVKQKEEYQEKLFEENVVLPRSVAQARAKEFSDMQARLQTLEARLVGVRDHSEHSRPASPRSLGSELSILGGQDTFSSEQPSGEARRLIKAPELNMMTTPVLENRAQICSSTLSSPEKPEKLAAVGKVLQSSAVQKSFEDNPTSLLSQDQPQQIPLGKYEHQNQKTKPGLISQIKAFVKGHSDSSEENLVPAKSNIQSFASNPNCAVGPIPTNPKVTAPSDEKAEENGASITENLSVDNVFLSASCGSSSEEASPEYFQPVFTETKGSREVTVNSSLERRPIQHLLTKLKNVHNAPEPKTEENKLSVVQKSAVRQARKLKSYFSTKPTDFQIHYQSKLANEVTRESVDDNRKEEGGSESEDSWCVIFPKVV